MVNGECKNYLPFTIYRLPLKLWLGDRDSNPDRQIQKLQSYH